MEGETDLVYGASAHLEWAHAVRNQCACLDLTTWRANHHPTPRDNAAFLGQFWTEFCEECWLQRIEPGEPACHRSTDMVLGESVGGDDNGIVLVSNGCQRIILTVPVVLGDWIALLLIEHVGQWRLDCLIVGR